jgi:hypothetical protein
VEQPGRRHIKTEFLINDDGSFSIQVGQSKQNTVNHLGEVERRLVTAIEHLSVPEEYTTHLNNLGIKEKPALHKDDKGNLIIEEPIAGVLLQADKNLRDKLSKKDPDMFSDRATNAGLIRSYINLKDANIVLSRDEFDDKNTHLSTDEALKIFKRLLSEEAHITSAANYEKGLLEIKGTYDTHMSRHGEDTKKESQAANVEATGTKKTSPKKKINAEIEPGSSIEEKRKAPATKKTPKINAVKKKPVEEKAGGGGGFVESTKVNKSPGDDFRQL